MREQMKCEQCKAGMEMVTEMVVMGKVVGRTWWCPACGSLCIEMATYRFDRGGTEFRRPASASMVPIKENGA